MFGSLFSGLSSGMGSFGAGMAAQGNAQADMFQAQGEFNASVDYRKAADIATQNVGITKMATDIQNDQVNRKIEKTEGTQSADAGANNVTGGSANYLLQQSFQQGSAAKAAVNVQGAITENGYKEQAIGYTAQADMAFASGQAMMAAAEGQNRAAGMSFLSGGLSILGGLFSLI